MLARSRILLIAVACIIASSSGCSSLPGFMQRRADHSLSRVSFIRWNLERDASPSVNASTARALSLAKLSKRELDFLLAQSAAPDKESLAGEWRGINKGIGPALIGMTQDVKTFRFDGCETIGHNIMVNQVPICRLDCRGWIAKREILSGEKKTIGNFVAISQHSAAAPLLLDYTIADNPWYDPSRLLVDELVSIDDDLLLGRANILVAGRRVPIAYFVLFRDAEIACDQAW